MVTVRGLFVCSALSQHPSEEGFLPGVSCTGETVVNYMSRAQTVLAGGTRGAWLGGGLSAGRIVRPGEQGWGVCG